MTTGDQPRIMGAQDSHAALREALARHEPKKVLDAAAGQGALAVYLRDLGWDVHCADILPEFFKPQDIPVTKADLNRRLPFEDGSFDAVVCANAIHRLFNPAGALREMARLLRDGGTLFLNANNFATIDLRLRFLLYGAIEHRQTEQGIDPVGEPEANVRIYWTYPQIANYLEAAGFEIRSVKAASVHRVHHILRPLSWCLRLATYLIPASRRRRDRIDVTSSSRVLGGGYYFLLEAAKKAPRRDV